MFSQLHFPPPFILDHQLSAGVSDQQHIEAGVVQPGVADEKRLMSGKEARAALRARYIPTRVDIFVSLS